MDQSDLRSLRRNQGICGASRFWTNFEICSCSPLDNVDDPLFGLMVNGRNGPTRPQDDKH